MTDLPRKERRVSEKTTDKKASLSNRLSSPLVHSTTTLRRGNMLVPKRPRSVYDHRPVAVQVVKQENGAVDKHVLIVERPQNKPAPPKRSRYNGGFSNQHQPP
jgi:hypothetical protein